MKSSLPPLLILQTSLGELIAHGFEYLSIDSVIFDPPLLDKENWALTPPYILPQSVATDLGHSDPEAE